MVHCGGGVVWFVGGARISMKRSVLAGLVVVSAVLGLVVATGMEVDMSSLAGLESLPVEQHISSLANQFEPIHSDAFVVLSEVATDGNPTDAVSILDSIHGNLQGMNRPQPISSLILFILLMWCDVMM